MTSRLSLFSSANNVRLRYQILAFVLARTTINTSYRMVYPFLPTIARGLGVELQAVTLAVTARSAVGLVGPLLGSLADLRGRKTALLFGSGLFTIAMLLVSYWPTYPALFTALLLTSASKIIFDPAMHAFIGDRVVYSQRGLAIALTEFGWAGAFLLGVPVTGWLIARGGWNAPFPFLATLGLGIVAGLWYLIPNDIRHKSTRPSFRQGVQYVVTSPAALAGLAVTLLISGSSEMVGIVYGLWMEQSFGLQIAALGAASAIIGIAELGGEGLVAVLADRFGKRRALGAGILCYALSCLLLPLLSSTLPGALIGLFFFYITFEFTVVTTIPLMTQLVPTARATLMSSMVAGISLGRSVGAFIGPMLFASFGIGGNSLAAAACNLVALALLILFVREKLTDD